MAKNFREKTKPEWSKRSKTWCFTSFHKDKPQWSEDDFSYLIYGKETCPETGKDHWQGYVECKNRICGSKVFKLLGYSKGSVNRKCDGWIAVRRSRTGQKAADYCKKEGEFKEIGELDISLSQGHRSDIDILNKAKEKNEVRKLCNETTKYKKLFGSNLGAALALRKFEFPEKVEFITVDEMIKIDNYEDKVYVSTGNPVDIGDYLDEEIIYIEDVIDMDEYDYLRTFYGKRNVKRRSTVGNRLLVHKYVCMPSRIDIYERENMKSKDILYDC